MQHLKCGCPRNPRQGIIFGQSGEVFGAAGEVIAAPGDNLPKMRPAIFAVGIPALDGPGRPVRRLIFVAIGAGIRRAGASPEVGARNAEGMIAPSVNDHIVALDHMAVLALGPVAVDRMKVMRRVVVIFQGERREVRVARRAVALGTDAISACTQSGAVRLVTVGAGHTVRIHLGLQKRAVDVDLIEYLPVSVIAALSQSSQPISIVKLRAGKGVSAFKRLSSRMATSALLDIGLATRRHVHREPGAGQSGPARLRIGPLLRPGQMRLPGAVACLAADTDLGLPAGVSAALRPVILVEVRGMTFGATGVPVLVGAGPVQAVPGKQRLIGVEMIPALFFRIPNHIEGLETALFRFQKVLLQWLDPDDGMHRILGHAPVRTVRFDHVGVAIAEKARGYAVLREGRIAEIAQYVLGDGWGPRLGMVRSLPNLHFVDVAIRAGVRSDVLRGGCLLRVGGYADQKRGQKNSNCACSAIPHSRGPVVEHLDHCRLPPLRDSAVFRNSRGLGRRDNRKTRTQLVVGRCKGVKRRQGHDVPTGP